MWRLNPPDFEDASGNLETALTLANGTVVHPVKSNEKDRILELYTNYDIGLGNPDKALEGIDLDEPLRQALYDAYSQIQKGGRLAIYRDRLKLIAEACPYCGFGAITDLDHHLPRSIYKVHSLYSKNLIPSCHPCNNLKRAKCGESASTQFSHVYFGPRPTEPFLSATIEILAKGINVTYEINKTPTLDEAEHERLSFQFKTLELNTRYSPQINLFLGGLRTSIEDCARVSSGTLKAYLDRAYVNFCKDFGPNHWQTALLKALAESDEFCDGGYKFCFGRRNPAI